MTIAERIVPFIPHAPVKLRLFGRQGNHESSLKSFLAPGRLIACTWILASLCVCASTAAESPNHEWVATW